MIEIKYNKECERDQLSYFLVSSGLFGISLKNANKNLVFVDGVPKFNYPFGRYHNPAYICWWALLNLEEHIKQGDKKKGDKSDKGDERFLNEFFVQAKWLLENAKKRGDALVWTYDFDWKEGAARLKKPWISAMSQGLAISVLVRAYALSKDRRYLSAAYSAAKIFDITVSKGGVKTEEDSHIYYEEYPSFPLPRVLDGFIFSLLGLYDLYRVEKDRHAKALFDDGVSTLADNVQRWDFRRSWSWYGTHGILCTPSYNALNSALLFVLYRLTGNKTFARYSSFWSGAESHFFRKISVAFLRRYCLFLFRLKMLRG